MDPWFAAVTNEEKVFKKPSLTTTASDTLMGIGTLALSATTIMWFYGTDKLLLVMLCCYVTLHIKQE